MGQRELDTEPEAFEPEGSSIIVQVRAADTVPGLGNQPWVEAENGVDFQIFGRYLQVRSVLRPAEGGTSPVLSDLRIGFTDDAEVSIGDAGVVEGDGGLTNAVFEVTPAEPTVLETRLDYAAVGDSATVVIDFEDATGTLVIATGETSGTITVGVIGDDLQELDETFTVELSNPIKAILLDAVGGAGTIVDDDLAALTVTKSDALLDGNGDGEANPGEVLSYQIGVAASGTAQVSSVELADTIPTHTTLVSGSVTTTQGTVTGDDPIAVSLGDLHSGASTTMSFEVLIDSPLPGGVE